MTGRTVAPDRPAAGPRPAVTASSLSEAILIALACLAPWAYGSVDSWAEFVLLGGVAVVAVLRYADDWRADAGPRGIGPAGWALAGLGVLALAQVAPMPGGVISLLAPSLARLRSGLAPPVPESVLGDPLPPVALPASTLSIDPGQTYHGVAQLAVLLLLFDAVARARWGDGALRRFAQALSWNGALLGLFAVGQALTWNGAIYGVRRLDIKDGWLTGGPFASHNHLAAYLNLALGLALGLMLSANESGRDRAKPRRSSLLLGAYAAGLIAVGVIGSHSRGGFLAMASACLLMGALAWFKKVRPGYGVAALALILAAFLVVLGSSSPLERVASIADSGETGFNGRTEVWAGALRTWASYPLWGSGMGTFPVASAAQYTGFSRFQGLFFSHAESEYFNMLVEGGAVGLVLLLAFVAASFRRGWRALATARAGARGLVLGALFGLFTVAVQSLADFPLHVPAVAVPAVILAATLGRLGAPADGPGSDGSARARNPASPRAAWRRAGLVLRGLALAGLIGALAVHQARQARVERLVARAGLPLPNMVRVSVDSAQGPPAKLAAMEADLVAALRVRPSWAEGHLRLGLVRLGRYRAGAAEWLGIDLEKEQGIGQAKVDPLWLHGTLHSARPEQIEALGPLLEHEPIRDFLAPAARDFLEARRCSPLLAVPHARLASLDFLLKGGDPPAAYLNRTLRLSGNDAALMLFCGQVAIQLGDVDRAVRFWKTRLETTLESWELIADVAGNLSLPPDQVLDLARSGGSLTVLRFGDRLYDRFLTRPTYKRFLEAALKTVATEPRLSPAERLWYEGVILAKLDRRDEAAQRMTEAVESNLARTRWRHELAYQLLAWERYDEAYRQAQIGLLIDPSDSALENLRRVSLEKKIRVLRPDPAPAPK